MRRKIVVAGTVADNADLRLRIFKMKRAPRRTLSLSLSS